MRTLLLRNLKLHRRVGFDLAYEAVAAFGERLDIAGIVGGVSQRLADLVYRGGQTVFEINECVCWP